MSCPEEINVMGMRFIRSDKVDPTAPTVTEFLDGLDERYRLSLKEYEDNRATYLTQSEEIWEKVFTDAQDKAKGKRLVRLSNNIYIGVLCGCWVAIALSGLIR
tara:strand:+ start:753 stop:1061 length:309 start_codon:yes stop_codon:yes gene_type:complete